MANNKKHILFFVTIAAVVVTIGGLIYYQESIIQGGDTTILATRPVDPRDLFRGEYVILRYEIENDEKIRSGAQTLQDGDFLYIKLDEDANGIARVSEVSQKPPKSFDELWIKGEVSYSRVRFPSLEQFYVPEGAGKPIERLGSDLHVEITLKDGEARVTRLLDESLNEVNPESYLE